MRAPLIHSTDQSALHSQLLSRGIWASNFHCAHQRTDYWFQVHRTTIQGSHPGRILFKIKQDHASRPQGKRRLRPVRSASLKHHIFRHTLIHGTARNSDLNGVISSMKQMEDRFNKKFQYPYVFLNDQPFEEAFKTSESPLCLFLMPF